MESCKLCKKPLPPNFAPRKCAFLNGVFSPENWNCGTANALRQMVDGVAVWSNDQNFGIVAIGEFPEYIGDHLLVSWYKSRGAVDGAWVSTGEKLEPITLASAEQILAAHIARSEAPAVSGNEEG